MGNIISARCNDCGFENDFYIGCGIGIQNPTIVRNSLHGSDLERWDMLQADGSISFFQSQQKIMKCEHCNQIRNTLEICITLKNQTEIVLGDHCEQCGEPLKPLDPNHILCPECGKSELFVEISRHWE
jgi:methionyl-tRNA synthetase